MQKITIFFISVFVLFSLAGLLQNAGAVSVSIDTEKKTYFFGDLLTFTVQVSEVTGDLAYLHLTDENGKKSSAIPFPITELKTTETFPFPFDPVVYPQGKWQFDIEYSGSQDVTEFYLKDSGQIIIPIWIKDVGKMWVQGLITDNDFARGIEYLIQNEIIVIPPTENGLEKSQKIPQWIKTSTKWWVEGQISDNDFGLGLQHLIKIGVIVV